MGGFDLDLPRVVLVLSTGVESLSSRIRNEAVRSGRQLLILPEGVLRRIQDHMTEGYSCNDEGYGERRLEGGSMGVWVCRVA